MKYSITVGLLLLTFFLTTMSKAENDATGVIVEAVRNSGENSNLLRSGYAEFDVLENQHFSSEIIQKYVGGLETKIKANSKNVPAHVVSSNLENLQRMRKELERKDAVKFRYRLLFTGNDIYFNLNSDCKRHRVVEQYATELGKWLVNEWAIMDGSPNAGSVFANFSPGTKTATVEGQTRLGYEFQRFGRMQKSSAYHTMLQCMGQDRKKFQITDKTVRAFKEKMKEKGYSFEIAGTTTYDNNKTATILEVKSEGRIVERFWIDPSRNSICPLIQCFDEKGKIETECKSCGYFLHEKTGLWYPENYEETRSFSFLSKSVYTLNRETFQLNQAVSDEMFTLDIPERTEVIDKRSGAEEIKYTAMDKGVLSLKKGGLDLKKMKWLMREGDLTYGKEEPSAAFQGFRYVLMTAGILLIVFALLIKYRKWKIKK